MPTRERRGFQPATEHGCSAASDWIDLERKSVICGSENLPTNKIFLPSIRGFFGRKERTSATSHRAEGMELRENFDPKPRNFG